MLAWADGREGACFVKKLLATNPLWLWTRDDEVKKFAALLDEALSCQTRIGAPILVWLTIRKPLAAAFPVSLSLSLSPSSPDHVRARRWP